MIYIIQGDPLPLARPRLGHPRKVYDSQHAQKLVNGIHIQHQHNDRPIFEGPLLLDVTFFMKMSQIAKKSKNDKNYTYHHCRPDLDNLIKFILDVANKIIYHDDAQISSIIARKLYHENPRTEFTITPLKRDQKHENHQT